MSSNRILTSELFSTITKGGKQVALGVATETQEWKRPKETARAQGPGFKNAVMKDSASLPAGTAELIQRSVAKLLNYCATKTDAYTEKASILVPVTRKTTGQPLLETRIISISRPFTSQTRNRPHSSLVAGYPYLKPQ